MKKTKLLLLALATLFISSIVVSCKKDKNSKPIISVSPEPLYIYGNVGDLINLKINVSSSVRLNKVTITGQPDNETPHLMLDTAITTKGTNFTYYYRLPLSLAGKSIVLDFKAEDENGNVGEVAKRIFITALSAVQPIPLTETAGHRMYSNLSTNPDSYNLETNTGDFSISADTASRDIQDFSGTSSTLSNSWNSPAGGKFVKYNGFDYANATDSTTIAAYTSGVKLSILNGLQIGDIIITKLGSVTTNKYVLMRLTDIVDVAGKDSDYYEFSIKK